MTPASTYVTSMNAVTPHYICFGPGSPMWISSLLETADFTRLLRRERHTHQGRKITASWGPKRRRQCNYPQVCTTHTGTHSLFLIYGGKIVSGCVTFSRRCAQENRVDIFQESFSRLLRQKAYRGGGGGGGEDASTVVLTDGDASLPPPPLPPPRLSASFHDIYRS